MHFIATEAEAPLQMATWITERRGQAFTQLNSLHCLWERKSSNKLGPSVKLKWFLRCVLVVFGEVGGDEEQKVQNVCLMRGSESAAEDAVCVYLGVCVLPRALVHTLTYACVCVCVCVCVCDSMCVIHSRAVLVLIKYSFWLCRAL